MGNIKDLVGMIPGMGKKVKDIDMDNESFKPIEAIINSMTPKERSNPEIINGSRKKRIASGSGNSVQEINQLLNSYLPAVVGDSVIQIGTVFWRFGDDKPILNHMIT